MSRVFVTGSADGLGRAAALTLLEQGHDVVVHTRSRDRLTAVRDLLDRGAAAAVGDLADLEATHAIADQRHHHAVQRSAGAICRRSWSSGAPSSEDGSMHRSHDRGVQTAGRLAGVASALLVAVAVTGCGENDPGDPVSVARDLAAPMPPGGRVDVYCSPSLPLDD